MFMGQSNRVLEILIGASGNIKSRKMSCVGHVARIGEIMNTYQILVRKLKTPEAKIPFGRPRCR
jgi:hypothetical protein